jgi:hypothetical protein
VYAHETADDQLDMPYVVAGAMQGVTSRNVAPVGALGQPRYRLRRERAQVRSSEPPHFGVVHGEHPLTGVAGAEDLEVVTDLAKPVLCGYRVGPPLHRRARYLDRTTADAADQMMMVAC